MDGGKLAEETEIRSDYVEKVTGAARFVSDLAVPDMLHGRILRSPLPHARIRQVDVSAAVAMPGVVAVLTGADLAGMNPYWGMYLRDRPIIAIDRVRYVGDPVVAVAAEDEYTAEEALERIRVDYEALPYVTDVEEALKPEAPLVHDRMVTQKDFYARGETRAVDGTNIFQHYQYAHGDVDAAFASAARVFEDRFTFPMVFHYAMEPHVVIADVRQDAATVWTSGQSLSAVQKVLAQLFGFELAKIRVLSSYVGGGFGGKAFVKLDPLAVALSWKAKRPVRLCLSIAESMLTARRLAGVLYVKTAVDTGGLIVGKAVRAVMNGGAYSDTGPIVAVKAAIRAIGPYRIPNLKLEALGVYTNTVPGAAFRSIGGPQGVWASESQMDIIADALGEDPVQFRLANMLAKGEHVRPDLRPIDVDMAAMLTRAVDEMDRVEGSDVAVRGVAVGVSDPGIFPLAAATVRLRVDGSVTVHANTVEIGQGSHGVLRSIAARLLAQPLTRVTYIMPDTDAAPYDWGTGGSRSTVVMGKAIEAACADIVAHVTNLAADVLGGESASYVLVKGGLLGPSGIIKFAELMHRAVGTDSGEFVGIGRISPRTPGMAPAPIFWETSAGVGETEVDVETGEVQLRRYVSIADVGAVLNPKAAEGQDEGAAVQGLGHTLFEELLYEDGQPINASMIDYHVPTIDEVPAEFVTILVESRDGPGPFGARGMGEGAILPVAPVVANALARRYGVRIRDLPLTPERVWRALREVRARVAP